MNKEEELREDRQIISFWQPFSFDIKENHDYLRNGKLKTFCYMAWRGFAHFVMYIYENIILGVKFYGCENVPNSGGAVVICNHVHYLDCTLVDRCLLWRRNYFTTLETNFKIPVVRHLIRWLGAIPIPTTPGKQKRFLGSVTEAIAEGSFVSVYPEGILYPYYKGTRKFRNGAFHIAKRAECPIIPMVISFHKVQGIRKLFRHREVPDITVFPPISGEEVKSMTVAELKNKCHELMEEYSNRQK